uniref:Uncharacterized protein n=1 Tax=Crocodylus porosus TaxID=8502 RepID=A0A7M4EM95_CROPO
MLHLSKAIVSLLFLVDYISSGPIMTTSPNTTHQRQFLSEIFKILKQYEGDQVYTSAPIPITINCENYPEKLCQVAKALETVTKCKSDYQAVITNLFQVYGYRNCSLPTETEIYLKAFLQELTNLAQGAVRTILNSS